MNMRYKPTNSGEKLLKTYRGYPITYCPQGFGYAVKAGGDVDFRVQSNSNKEIMKKNITDAIRKAETSIDIYVTNINSQRQREEMEAKLFEEIAEIEQSKQYANPITSKEFVFPEARP